MARSAAREKGEIAAVAQRDCATLPAREAAALARRIPFGSGIGAGVGQDEGRGEVARGYVFIERVEQAQPLHQPPALGGAGLTRRDRSGARHDPSVECPGRRLALSDMIVGRHHIGERLIVHAIGDPESVAAAADSEHEMPLTVCEPFGGNAARSGDVGQGGSREEIGRATCWGSVCKYVYIVEGAVELKKKK